MWQLFIEVEKKKQGQAIYLIPTKCLRDFTSEVVPHENGTTNISKKQGTLFLKNQNTHLAFEEFYDFYHPPGFVYNRLLDKIQIFIILL